MQKDRIASALSSASDTKDFIIGAGCIENTPALFKKHFKDAKAVIVADENTFKAAGDHVNRILVDSGVEMPDPYIFPGKPVLLPDYRHIEKLKSFFQNFYICFLSNAGYIFHCQIINYFMK